MRDGFKIIDADGHIEEPLDLWDRYLDKRFAGVAPRVTGRRKMEIMGTMLPRLPPRTATTLADQSYKLQDLSTRFGFAYERNFDATSQLMAMDMEGIDKMVLYPSLGLFITAISDLDGRVASALSRAYNRWMAEFCSHAPDRLIGVAIGSLHDPRLAAEDLRYAVDELGLKAMMLRPNPVHGRNLQHPSHDVFWATAAELGVPIATHEGSGAAMPSYGDRFDTFLELHAMCHQVEQMGAVMSFTVGGILERHPQLKFIILECGASWLPSWLHRLDEHVEMAGELDAPELRLLPTDYFRRQGCISVEGDEPTLQAAIEYIGEERVLWASDYPHSDCGFPGTTDKFLAAPSLSDAQKRRILWDNPLRAYDLAESVTA